MTMVESSVPSRRMVAVNVVRSLLERMEPSDRMTLVAFDDQSDSSSTYRHPVAMAKPSDNWPMSAAAERLWERPWPRSASR